MKQLHLITHSGVFHTDELMAIALIKLFFNSNVQITRTRDKGILGEAVANPNVMLVDVGGSLNPDMLNFDHHQDIDLHASNMQIFNYLFDEVFIDEDLKAQLYPLQVFISAVDTNFDNIHGGLRTLGDEHNFQLSTLQSIVNGFNADNINGEEQEEAFLSALSFMETFLNNEVRSAKKRIEAESTYAARTVNPDGTAEFEKFCPIWKQKGDHKFALLPGTVPGQWAVNSADSTVNPLPDVPETMKEYLVFAHKGRFVSIFSDKSVAQEFMTLAASV